MSIYKRPDSDKDTLYKEFYYDQMTLTEIHEMIYDHFGPGTFDDFEISIENIKVEGCSCCYGSSDYSLYMIIKRKPV